MALQTPASELPLLCALGRHRPERLARWNDGYYFSRCRRCGTDLVRTAYGSWQVPKGFRVVWQAGPPASAVAAQLVPAERSAGVPEAARPARTEEPRESVFTPPVLPAAAVAASAAVALNEEPVAAHAAVADEWREPDGATEVGDVEPVEAATAAEVPAPEAPAAEAPAPVEAKSYAIPDFMDDGFDQPLPPIPAGPRTSTPAGPGADRDPEPAKDRWHPGLLLAGAAGLVAAARGRTAEWMAKLRARRMTSDGVSLDSEGMGTPALAFLTSFVIIAATIYFFGAPDRQVRAPVQPAKPSQFEAVQAAPSPATGSAGPSASAGTGATPFASRVGAMRGEVGFVSASLLNCRSAPAAQAETVRRIARGERIEILSRDGAWASIGYMGGQCWVLNRYISTVEPLSSPYPARGDIVAADNLRFGARGEDCRTSCLAEPERRNPALSPAG